MHSFRGNIWKRLGGGAERPPPALIGLNNYKDDIDMSLGIGELRELISQLNNQQRKLFDDFVERLCDVNKDRVPFNNIYWWWSWYRKVSSCKNLATKYLGKLSGSELENPSVLVMAPTGNAAFIVHGKTIESALGMRPQKNHNYTKMPCSVESTLRFTYENVLSIFIGEISMVGCN